MPLLIQGKQEKLPADLEIELRGELRHGKTLKFPARLKTKTKDSYGNVVEEWPKVRSIPYVAFIDLDLDTFKPATKESIRVQYSEVRFYKTMKAGPNNTLFPSPSSRIDLGVLQPHEVEEFWFLKYCSPFVENGENAKANKFKNFSCIIFDPELEENEQVERDSIIFEAIGYIYNRENMGGLSEAKVREIAAAFGVKDSLNGRIAGVKTKLKRAIEIDEVKPTASGDPILKGFKYMIKLATDKNYDFSLRANITKAIELNILEYVPSKKGWYFLAPTAPGQPRIHEEKIVSCEPNVNIEGFLSDYLTRNSDTKSRIESKISEKSTVVGGGDEEYDRLKSQKAKLESDGDVEGAIEVIEKMLVIKPVNPKLKGELKNLKQSLEV